MKVNHWILVFFGFLFACFVLVFFSFPYLLSTEWGKKHVVEHFDQKIPGSIKLSSLQVSWFDNQKIKGLEIFDPEGGLVVVCEQVYLKAGLFNLLALGSDVKGSTVTGLMANISQNKNGKTNIHRAFGLEAPQRNTFALQAPIKGDIEIQKGTLGISPFSDLGFSYSGLSADFNVTALAQNWKEQGEANTQQNGKFSIKGSIKDFDKKDFDKILTGERITFLNEKTEVNVSATFDQWPTEILDQFFSFFKPEFSGLFVEMLGQTVDLKFDKEVVHDHLNLKLHAFSTHLRAEATINANIAGKMGGGEFTLSDPGELLLYVTPQFVNNFSQKILKNRDYSLLKPFKAFFSIHELSVPILKETVASSIKAKGKVRLSETEVKIENYRISLQNIEMPWDYNGVKQSLLVDLSGDAGLVGQNYRGSFKGNSSFSNFIQGDHLQLNQADVDFQVLLQNFPTALLSSFSQVRDLPTLVGRELDATFKSSIQKGGARGGQVDVSLQGDQFDFRGSFEIVDAYLRNVGGSSIYANWLLTPQRFSAFRKLFMEIGANPRNMELVQNGKLKLEIDFLSFPYQTLDFFQAGIKGEFSIDRLMIKDPQEGQVTIFENFSTKINAPNVSKQIDFEVDGKGRVQNYGKPTGNLDIKGSVKNAFNSQKRWNTYGLDVELNANVRNAPAGLISNLLLANRESREQLAAIFGNSVDLDLFMNLVRMNGPIRFNLDAVNSQLNLDAKIYNRNFFLNKPIIGTLRVTPNLSKTVLKKFNPLLVQAISSKDPIKIFIDSNSFSIPVQPFDLAKAKIGRISVDFGKMLLKNRGDVALIMELLKSNQSANQDTMEMWFTPLYFNYITGVVTCERMDMLISGEFPVCMWGKVDTVRDKVDMVLGLTGYALMSSLGIDRLDPNYLLQIPVKGTTSKTKINNGAAVAKIASLVAQNQGGDFGIIGGIFGAIVGGKDKKVPKPTTQPFPWNQNGEWERAWHQNNQNNQQKSSSASSNSSQGQQSGEGQVDNNSGNKSIEKEIEETIKDFPKSIFDLF